MRSTATAILAAAIMLALSLAGASPAAAARCKKADAPASKITKAQARKAVRCLVNRARTGRNLKNNRKLQKAAQRHSGKMLRSNCFSHRCRNEPPLKRRVKRAGYTKGATSYGFGEVILRQGARGTARQAVRGWMGSPGHRAILLGGYKHIGVGLAIGGGRSYWTGVVGTRSG